jgi:hypothetical protein
MTAFARVLTPFRIDFNASSLNWRIFAMGDP